MYMKPRKMALLGNRLRTHGQEGEGVTTEQSSTYANICNTDSQWEFGV